MNIYPGKIPVWADAERPLHTRTLELAGLVNTRLGLSADGNLPAAHNGDLIRTRLATAGGQPPIFTERSDPRFYEISEFVWAMPSGGTAPALVRCGVDWAVELSNWAWEREAIARGPAVHRLGPTRIAHEDEALRLLLERSSDRVKAWATIDSVLRSGKEPYNLTTARKARRGLVLDWIKAARLNRLDGTPHTPREVWEKRARRALRDVERCEDKLAEAQVKLAKARESVERWRAKGFLP